MTRLMAVLAAACCAYGGCDAASDSASDAGMDAPYQCQSRAVDLLVVKGVTSDDTDTKLDVGTALGRSLQRSAELLVPGDSDVRMGVISSNLGSFGSTQWDCAGQSGDPLVGDGAILLTVDASGACSDCDPTRILGATEWPAMLSLTELAARGGDSVTEAVACAFACSGSSTFCNVPQQLEALHRAPAANAGLVRDGAVFAVLFTAAMDDSSTADSSLWADQHFSEAHCFRAYRSAEFLFPVSDYVDSVRQLHAAGPIVLAALAAPGDFSEAPATVGCPDGSVAPVCRSVAATSLYPTARIRQFVSSGTAGACPDVKGLALDYCAADLAAQFDVFVAELATAAGVPR